MKTNYDVTIIGAGPAGLMAAITAAREGLRVLLVERKSGISRVQRSCCSSLIMEPDTHGESVTLADNKINFPKNGFSVPYKGPCVPLLLAIRFSPSGNKLVFTQKGQPLAVSINKESLLDGLVQEAEQEGVTIFNNTLALKAENAGDRVVVSHDSVWCWKGEPIPAERWAAMSADAFDPTFFSRKIIPRLREEGVSEQAIEGLLVANPRRFFEGGKLDALA